METEAIEQRIYTFRGRRVMLDSDLAVLYGVSVGRLNEQVRRNRTRFPADFMFELTSEELRNLKSQIAISSWGGRRSLPLAFTEHGVAMLSSVLRSERAIETNILIIRAFIKLRGALAAHKELAGRFDELERKVAGHDTDIRKAFAAIRELMTPPAEPPKEIGFKPR